MPINQYRTVQYTDDGCSDYQCLLCYKIWEGRSGPGGDWRFCPFCGTCWDGERPQSERQKRMERFWELRHRRSMDDMLTRVQKVDIPGYWWVFDKRTTTTWRNEPPVVGKWERFTQYDGRYSAVEILELMRRYRAIESADPIWPNSKVEIRVQIVRERPAQGYINSHFEHGAWVIPETKTGKP